jgi:DNA-binding MarR family transcriptional regulator
MGEVKTPSKVHDGRESLVVQIKTLHQAIRVALEAAAQGTGQSLTQQAVLVAVARQPTASNAALARAAFVSPQSMGELLQELERKGLVTRAPSSANARMLHTQLTPAGQRALSVTGEKLAAVEQRLTSGLSQQETKALQSLLSRCLESFR